MGQTAIRFKSPADAIKRGLAFCSEDRKAEGIFPYMSIQDNLTMTILPKISRFGILNKKKQKEVTLEYIQKIAIKTPGTSTKIKDLSGGNQQKVILSRWLATHPDLIILDEPTRGIDVGAKGEIEELYISSELDELVRECDRIVILHDGRNVGELVNEEINSDAIMNVIASGQIDI